MGRVDDGAKAVLAEYHAIRKEYNGLDRGNPDHSKRRQELKARYYELNRRYARLARREKNAARNATTVAQSRRTGRPDAVHASGPSRSGRRPGVAGTDMRPPGVASAREIQRPTSSRFSESTRPGRSVGEGLPGFTARRSAPESPITAKVLALGGWSIVGVGIALAVSFITGVARDAVIGVFEALHLSVVADLRYGLIVSGATVLLGGTLIGVAAFARHFIRHVVPIHEHARKGRVDALARAIAIGADIDARDRRGCTPLHFAVVAGHENAASVLLQHGADPEAANERGETPLFMAAANRDLGLVNFLIGMGAKARATNNNGSTLMHIAASAGDLDLMKLAENQGLDVQGRTKQGYTPLHFAGQSGNAEVLERLLAAGADPDASCKSGATPLCAAARTGHKTLVRILIRAGADVNTKPGYDYLGPLGVAFEGKHGAVVDYLRKHGATTKRAQPAA